MRGGSRWKAGLGLGQGEASTAQDGWVVVVVGARLAEVKRKSLLQLLLR